MKTLSKIQKELKAPKGQLNEFGGYKYRSCEDILEAVKPLLGEAVLTITDEIVLIGDRYYIKATATLSEKPESISVSAFAREALVKKGMDESQITGAASSYARKYALNGLFCIDDTKDADSNGDTKEVKSKPEVKAPQEKKSPAKTKLEEASKKVEPRVKTEEEIADLACSECFNDITQAEKHYSLEKYGARLCRECQKNASPLKGKNE
jgi:hypothetical protein